MLRKILITGMVVMTVFACSKQETGVKLKPGTPAYNLADSLAEKLPMLDPDKNAVLIAANSFSITAGTMIRELHSNYGSQAQQLKQMSADRIRQIIVSSAKDLGEKKLLLEAAREAGTQATPAEVDSMLKIQYNHAGGEAKFRQNLERNGVSMEVVRNQLMEGLVIQNYLDEKLAARASVSEEEVQEEYGKDKSASVRHILFSTQGKSDSAKAAEKAEAEKVLEMAKSGEDFPELAREYSDDPGSKSKGGLYEDFGRGRMVPPFDSTAFSIPEGSISDLVKTRFGYHIIKVIDREAETQPIDSVRGNIESRLEQQKRQELFQDHLEELKKANNYRLVALEE